MSGTGRSDHVSRSAGGLTPAEQHLGDRLAALVDGELGHDARERVLSHLATCWSCKAEADAQRRLKNVFADTAPPPPSDGLLARLQGLPAGGPDHPGDGPAGPSAGSSEDGDGSVGGGLSPAALLMSIAGAGGSSLWPLDHLPGGRSGRSTLTPARGFRIHQVGRPASPAPVTPTAPVSGAGAAVLSASRGRRFAFVAAGAFSLAALALGGALGSGTAGSTAGASGDNTSAGPVRTTSAGASTARDGRRRGGSGGERRTGIGKSESAGKLTDSVIAATSATTKNRGFSVPAGRGADARRGPSASLGSALQPEVVYPLLRNAVSSPSLMRTSLPSAGYVAGSYADTPVGTVPGRAPAAHVPEPAPAVSAAPPGR